MVNMMEIKNGKVQVNGTWLDMTLEIANKFSHCDINDEFYSSESDIEWSIKEEEKKIADVNNTIDSDEVRLQRINNYKALLELSRSI
jgi:hypothetical protein